MNYRKSQIRLLGLLFTVCVALAQNDTATLVGTARDPQGGAVADAKVTVTSTTTGAERTTQTNAEGDYRLPALQIGSYRLQVEKPGFKRFLVQSLAVSAFQTLRVDAPLEVGEVTTAVDVSGAAPVVDTETNTVAESLPGAKLKNYSLPLLFGNSVAWLITTYSTSAVQYFNDMVVIGNRQDALRTTIDGATVDHFRSSPPALSVQEVRLVNGGANAEFPTPGTAAATTRGGSNQLHGASELLLMNQALNSLGPWGGARPVGQPDYSLHFGGSGPVFIPKIYDGRNRTFFSTTFNRRKSTTRYTPLSVNVPTEAMARGDFSGLRNASGQAPVITDPLTGTPFAGGVIPSARIADVSKNITGSYYPAPNTGNATNTLRNYYAIANSFGAQNEFFNRFDHRLSSQDTLTYSYMRLFQDSRFDTSTSGAMKVPGRYNALSENNAQTHSLGYIRVLNPAAVNEFRFSFNRLRDRQGSDVRGQDVISRFGIQGLTPYSFTGLPGVNITEMAGIGQVYTDNQFVENRFNLIDTVSVHRGRHALKMGTEFIRIQTNRAGALGPVFGTYDFSGQFTGQPFADFLLGYPGSTTRFTPRPTIAARQYSLGLYIQDDFKMSQRLTLNLGLRYDLEGIPVDANGLYFNFNPVTGGIVVPDQHALNNVSPLFNRQIPFQTASQAGFPDKLLVQDRNNFMPRVGLAYRPFNNNRTVARAYYGVFTVGKMGAGLRGAFLPLLQTGGPFALTETCINQRGANGAPLFGFPRPFLDQGTAPSSYSISGANPLIRDGYLQQWNLSVEHEVMNTAIGVTYTGNKLTNGQYARNINLPFPSETPFTQARYLYRNFTSIKYFDQGATDVSNTLRVDFNRPMHKGLYLHGGWTWLSQINDGETTAWVQLASTSANPYSRASERARIDYFPRHRFSVDFVYELPFGVGRKYLASAPRGVDAVLGGWVASGFWNFYTGEPFTPIYSGADPSGTGNFSGRPDRIGSGKLDNPTESLWFDPKAFVVPGSNIGRFGNSGRNILELPSTQRTLLAIYKYFKIKESLHFRLATYMDNPFNQHSFGTVQRNITAPNAGALIGPSGYGNWSRVIRFAGRLEF